MSHTSAKVLYLSPRILAIAFAGFLSIFALDVLDEAHGFWQTVLAFSFHLIPAAVIVAVLIAAWRWEWVGAGLFALAAAAYAFWALPAHLDWVFFIAGPLVVIAALFLANWIERPKLRAAL